MSTLQTLDRGLQALTILATHGGLTIAALSTELGIARANCYRIVTTLEHHGLVVRGVDGRIRIGGGIPALASHYWPGVLGCAEAALRELAEATGATGQMSVVEGDRGVVVLSVHPPDATVRIAFRVGYRHALVGAPGVAILAGRPARDDDPPEVIRARATGYATSAEMLHPGLVAIAAPIRRPAAVYAPEACLGLVAIGGSVDVEAAAEQVVAAASEVGTAAIPAVGPTSGG